MQIPQVSLQNLMAIVVLLGLGFMALLRPSEFWASATFTASVALLLLGPLGIVFGRGNQRRIWTGFSVFGWAYFLHTWRVQSWEHPPVLTTFGLFRLRAYMSSVAWNNATATDFFRRQIGESLATILAALVGSLLVRLLAPPDATTRTRTVSGRGSPGKPGE